MFRRVVQITPSRQRICLLGDNALLRSLSVDNGGKYRPSQRDSSTNKRYTGKASHWGYRSRSQTWVTLSALAGISALGAVVYMGKRKEAFAEAKSETVKVAGARCTDLPDFRLADIQKHKSASDGAIWVTYKDGVYDITEFMEGHPGGNKILLAAGGQLEPFWDLYAIHKNAEVFEILEGLRIGNIHPDDLKAVDVKSSKDPYANDPKRHPALVVNSAKPFNAEVPTELLVDNFITPNELFFVRNHLPVPKIDGNKFKLEVKGGKKPVKLSLHDLKTKFKPHTITATVQCAGNRRSDMNKVKAVKGLSWGAAAISNAEWTGVLLSDVLAYAGIHEEDYKHVLLEGMDKDMENKSYEASIPIETAVDPRKDVLLAFEMNGRVLPVDHGFPVRVIVPGTVGARQVKWVGRIEASQEESFSHWQRNDYKSFHPSIDWHNVDFSKAVAIQEYPVQSAVCEPKDGAVVEGDEVVVRGYSWSGGGRGIVRVDVTADGGKSWQEAELHSTPQVRHRQWAWTVWEATIPVPSGHQGPLSIACKATDTSHNTQPETVTSVWNLRGLINNAWHEVKVNVTNE